VLTVLEYFSSSMQAAAIKQKVYSLVCVFSKKTKYFQELWCSPFFLILWIVFEKKKFLSVLFIIAIKTYVFVKLLYTWIESSFVFINKVTGKKWGTIYNHGRRKGGEGAKTPGLWNFK